MVTQSVSGILGGLYISTTKVAECQDMTITINRGTQDASNADGDGWEECVGGMGNWQVQGSFNLIVGDAKYLVLQTALLAGTTVASVKGRSTATGYNWAGTVLPTQAQLQLFSLKNPQGVKWTLKGTGAITPSAS